MFNLPAFIPGQSVTPKTTVELTVSCRDLMDLDVFSKSDPVCIVYRQGAIPDAKNWIEEARTEIILNNLNPKWCKKFILEYRFEERQLLRFEIYDWDNFEVSDVKSQEFLGSLEVSLGELVSCGSVFSKHLDGVKSGVLEIVAEELLSNGLNQEISFHLSAKKLSKMSWFGKSDPFVMISKASSGETSSGNFVVVYKSEVVKNSLNPSWSMFSIPLVQLCNGDLCRALKFEVLHWNSNGREDVIGEFVSSLSQLKEAAGQGPDHCSFQLSNRRKKNCGKLIIHQVLFETVPTFLNFIQAGTQMNFTVAIDFTQSNGSPNDPSSLHYQGHLSPYGIAIRAVGDVIADYDSDGMYPALGFGARLPPDGRVSHEFFLSLNPKDPFCRGIDGILQAYQDTVGKIQFYGPTNFSPVIRHVTQFARKYHGDMLKGFHPLHYFVLLIITDGVITDFNETRKAIVDASSLPLSIIIVGVGNADYTAMNLLDSDDKILCTEDGIKADRDIVQFVEMRKYLYSTSNGSYDKWDKISLAKSVLEEIPEQFLSYMKKNGISPPIRS